MRPDLWGELTLQWIPPPAWTVTGTGLDGGIKCLLAKRWSLPGGPITCEVGAARGRRLWAIADRFDQAGL
jgi:hypothetical protein